MRAASRRLPPIGFPLLLAAACLTTPTSVAAQESAPASAEPGSLVHVTTVSGTDVRGRIVRVDERSMTVLRAGDREEVVERGEVDEIQVGESRVASYAKGGLIAGTLGMTVASAALLSELCSGSTDCDGEMSLGIAAGALVGALGGTLVGALIGAAATHWAPAAPEEWATTPSPVRIDLDLAEALAHGQPSVGLSVALPLPR